jgi:tRNA-uridine 2-sulfurtransferase
MERRVKTTEKLLVAMSGGVDSSLAAVLLREAGHEVIGATMKTFCYTGTPSHARTCCGMEGIMDARAVAKRLEIPHHIFDVEEDFTRDVIDDFVSEYAEGRTPNPCVRCNSKTKFGDLLRRARELGCHGIATGHYVRNGRDAEGRPALFRGRDRRKDQAYFLWELPTEALPLLHFPLGDLEKAEVRARARELELATADKPESQEICFVPTGDYRDLLKRRLAPRHPALESGPIVDLEGRVVGEHDGYAGFTVGQRKGLGGGFAEPHFVVEVRPATREVVVGPREALHRALVELHDLNWLAPAPSVGQEVELQIRHGAPPARAYVEGPSPAEAYASPGRDAEVATSPDAGSRRGGALRLRFEHPQRAITPGQSCAVFTGERLLGGGRILRSHPCEGWATTVGDGYNSGSDPTRSA